MMLKNKKKRSIQTSLEFYDTALGADNEQRVTDE